MYQLKLVGTTGENGETVYDLEAVEENQLIQGESMGEDMDYKVDFSCKICNKKCNSQRSLSLHINYHAKDKVTNKDDAVYKEDFLFLRVGLKSVVTQRLCTCASNETKFFLASISLLKNFHDARTIPSGRKVCVGGWWFLQ